MPDVRSAGAGSGSARSPSRAGWPSLIAAPCSASTSRADAVRDPVDPRAARGFRLVFTTPVSAEQAAGPGLLPYRALPLRIHRGLWLARAGPNPAEPSTRGGGRRRPERRADHRAAGEGSGLHDQRHAGCVPPKESRWSIRRERTPCMRFLDPGKWARLPSPLSPVLRKGLGEGSGPHPAGWPVPFSSFAGVIEW